jgi:hypothetical protein
MARVEVDGGSAMWVVTRERGNEGGGKTWEKKERKWCCGLNLFAIVYDSRVTYKSYNSLNYVIF